MMLLYFRLPIFIKPNETHFLTQKMHGILIQIGQSRLFCFCKPRLLTRLVGAAAFSGPQCAPGGLPAPPFGKKIVFAKQCAGLGPD